MSRNDATPRINISKYRREIAGRMVVVKRQWDPAGDDPRWTKNGTVGLILDLFPNVLLHVSDEHVDMTAQWSFTVLWSNGNVKEIEPGPTGFVLDRLRAGLSAPVGVYDLRLVDSALPGVTL